VQLVSRSRFGHRNEQRGYLGRVASGTIAVGDTVIAWPNHLEARVAEIITLDGTLEAAVPGRSITVVLDRQVDVARGELLSHATDRPALARRFAARLAWLDREPLALGRRYALKHATRTVRATVEKLESRVDLATLGPDIGGGSLGFNDLGTVHIAAAPVLVADPYSINRATGSFILVDEATNHTVAGGMISEVYHG
jgi:sulfate adenylyltransferase subunit 1 (EFTu-like GTPase family)